MTVPPLPRVVIDAARLRHEGRVHDAMALVEAAVDDARSTPYETPFRERVLLGLTLADLYQLNGRSERAQHLLDGEKAFADHVLELVRKTGTPEQIHAASAGCHQIHDRAGQLALLGRPAPEIDVIDWVLGTPTSLAHLRGHVMLLEFWATWCRSCAAMFPYLIDLHDRYAEAGLVILALTSYTDGPGGVRARERDAIHELVTGRGVEFRVGVSPDVGLRKRYGATGLPTFAVIDQAGVVTTASSKPDKAALEEHIVGLVHATDDIHRPHRWELHDDDRHPTSR